MGRINKNNKELQRPVHKLFCNKCGGNLVCENKQIKRSPENRILTCTACNNRIPEERAISKEKTKEIKSTITENKKIKCKLVDQFVYNKNREYVLVLMNLKCCKCEKIKEIIFKEYDVKKATQYSPRIKEKIIPEIYYSWGD